MERGALPLDVTSGVRSRAAIIAAATVGVFAVVDVVRGVPALGLHLSARFVWIGCLLATAWLLRSRRGGGRQPLYVMVGITSAASMAVLAHVDGGPGTSAYAFLLATPLFVAVFLPTERGAVAAAGCAAFAGALLVGGADGLAGGDLFMAGARCLAAGVLAYLGTSLQATVRRRELELEGARVRAEEALARSEARCAQVEGLAAAGSRAARAAHDLSSPLASVKCNVQWLKDQLDHDPTPAELAELREVVEETRGCVEKLAAEVQGLRSVVRAATQGQIAAPVDPAAAAPVARGLPAPIGPRE